MGENLINQLFTPSFFTSPYTRTHPRSVTSIGEVVSTNGVELNAALDALGKKADAQQSGARLAHLEKAVAEVGKRT